MHGPSGCSSTRSDRASHSLAAMVRPDHLTRNWAAPRRVRWDKTASTSYSGSSPSPRMGGGGAGASGSLVYGLTKEMLMTGWARQLRGSSRRTVEGEGVASTLNGPCHGKASLREGRPRWAGERSASDDTKTRLPKAGGNAANIVVAICSQGVVLGLQN